MPGLRHLVLLQPTRADVVRDSLSRHLLDFVEESCARGNFVYLACQTTINDQVVELPKLPARCLRVPVNTRCGDSIMQGRTVVDLVALSAFGRDFGAYPIDSVVVPVYAPAVAISQALAATPSSAGPPVFRVDPGTDLPPNDAWTASLVAAAAHPNISTVVLSKPEAAMWSEAIRLADLTNNQRMAAVRGLKVCPVRIDLQNIQSFLNLPKSSKFQLLYAGRSNASKNTQKILNAYADVWVTNPAVESVFLTQDPSWGKFTNFTEHPWVQHHTKVNRAAFYAKAAQGHVFVNWTEVESFHASFREAALLGCVCLSVDTPQMRALFPTLPERFWFKNDHGQAVAAINAVLADYPKARAEFQPFVEWVVAENAQPSIAEVVDQSVEALLTTTVLEPARNSYVLDPAKWPVFDTLFEELKSLKEDSISLSEYILRLKERFPPLDKYASAFGPWNARMILKYHYKLRDLCDRRFPSFDLTHLHSSAKD